MSFIYDIAFFIFSIFYLPILFFKNKYHGKFKERFGFLPDMNFKDQPIWIHAVSVGEVMAAKPLLEALRKEFPGVEFVISTITRAGNDVAQKLARPDDRVIFFPLDFSFVAGRVINKIQPRLIFIMETELWPNFITAASDRSIPVFLVNARISDKSIGKYELATLFLRPAINRISLFLAQTQQDADRLAKIGADKNKIRVMGNLKFDVDLLHEKNCAKENIAGLLKLSIGDKLFVAGSTHDNEEELIVGIYSKLIKRHPNLRLLIAPRHIERSGDIEKIIRKSDFKATRISNLRKDNTNSPDRNIFVLDTMGQLGLFYSAADIVFMGGSLVKRGGHNVIEPATLAKPIIFGPHMFNFRDIAELFLKNDAAVQVKSADELERSLNELLQNQDKAKELGAKAKEIILRNSGATSRVISFVKKSMER